MYWKNTHRSVQIHFFLVFLLFLNFFDFRDLYIFFFSSIHVEAGALLFFSLYTCTTISFYFEINLLVLTIRKDRSNITSKGIKREKLLNSRKLLETQKLQNYKPKKLQNYKKSTKKSKKKFCETRVVLIIHQQTTSQKSPKISRCSIIAEKIQKKQTRRQHNDDHQKIHIHTSLHNDHKNSRIKPRHHSTTSPRTRHNLAVYMPANL